MPESVADYAEHRSLQRCAEILDGLRETLRQDFPKYSARANVDCLGAVLESAPGFVGQQIKYSRLTDCGTGPTVKRAFELLEKARILTRVKASGAGGLPLGAGVSAGRFKAIRLDVGLWQRLAGVRADRELAVSDILDVHRGAMAEHANVKGGWVFSSRPYEELPEQKLTFLPIYYAGSAVRER